MFRCFFAVAVIATACNASFQSARADFIVDPTGTVLFDGNNAEDAVTRISNLNLRYFGQTISSVWVAENGNLNFSADGSFSPRPLGTPSVARIAPLWDDFWLLQNPTNTINNRVLVDSQPGIYLAVTWQNMRLYNEVINGGFFPNTTRSAQVVWFETDQSINGVQYRAGDIAFGYAPHVLGTTNFGTYLSATVGLDSGTGTIVALPGTVRGQITSANANLLGTQNQVILYQANAGGGYTASLQIVSVPEPASIALVTLGVVLLCARRSRTR